MFLLRRGPAYATSILKKDRNTAPRPDWRSVLGLVKSRSPAVLSQVNWAPPRMRHPIHSVRGPQIPVRAGTLLSLRTLTILLLLCCVLTAEEAIHLLRSRPNEIDSSRTLNHHPGCIVLDASAGVLRCPVRGYGGMNFLCSEKGCIAKNEGTGLFVSPAESQLLRRYSFK